MGGFKAVPSHPTGQATGASATSSLIGLSERPTLTATGIFGLATTFGGSSFHSPPFHYAGLFVIVASVVGYIWATRVALVTVIASSVAVLIATVFVVLHLAFGPMDTVPTIFNNESVPGNTFQQAATVLTERSFIVPAGACVNTTTLSIPGHGTVVLKGSTPSALGYQFSQHDMVPTDELSWCGSVAAHRLEAIPGVIVAIVVTYLLIFVGVLTIASRILPELKKYKDKEA